MITMNIGIYCEDNSRHVRVFTVRDFDAACERVYTLYPNWISILPLREDEITEFLQGREEE